jgi:hypothetical protein
MEFWALCDHAPALTRDNNDLQCRRRKPKRESFVARVALPLQKARADLLIWHSESVRQPRDVSWMAKVAFLEQRNFGFSQATRQRYFFEAVSHFAPEPPTSPHVPPPKAQRGACEMIHRGHRALSLHPLLDLRGN